MTLDLSCFDGESSVYRGELIKGSRVNPPPLKSFAILHTDASWDPHTGVCAIAYVIRRGEETWHGADISEANETFSAEADAFRLGMEACHFLGFRLVIAHTDNLPLYEWLREGKKHHGFETREKFLKRAVRAMKPMCKVRLAKISRDHNEEADALAREKLNELRQTLYSSSARVISVT